jgi:hypothetical protein
MFTPPCRAIVVDWLRLFTVFGGRSRGDSGQILTELQFNRPDSLTL